MEEEMEASRTNVDTICIRAATGNLSACLIVVHVTNKISIIIRDVVK